MEFERRCLFKDLDEVISNEYEVTDEAIAEQAEDYRVVAFDPFVYLPSQNLYFSEILFYQMNDEGEFEPDWAGAAVYKMEGGLLKIVGFEQDPMLTTAHNYLNCEGGSIDVSEEKVTIITSMAELVELNDITEKEEKATVMRVA